MKSEVFNEDCMSLMARTPDKFYELAIIDAPYGIQINESMGRRKNDKHSGHKNIKWDSCIPTKDYFDELFRVSVNQIIWGANYFMEIIAKNSPCWLLWDKMISEDLSFSQFELAWTSFGTTPKKFEFNNSRTGKIHPTQKPIALYRWLLKNYAKAGDKILDTHLGSGSSRIAAHEMGFDFTGCELDKDYFDAQEKRFAKYLAQEKLFQVEHAKEEQLIIL